MQKAPKIRFDGYTEDWEQRKLSELLSFSNGFNGSKDMYGEGIPYISVMDILNNDVITYDTIQGKVNLDDRVAQRYIVEYGDILFQRSSENIEDAGRSNVYVDTERTAVFGGFVIRGKKVSEYDPIFMKKNLETHEVRNQITSRAQGAQHINVGQETLGSVKAYFPSLNEQKIIGIFFQTLDSIITLHQKECEKMLDFKGYMLSKMFPQNGEKVPEIRFEDFTEDWEQRKLGEISLTFEYGLNAAAKEFDGENKYIRITDINDYTHEFMIDNVTSPDTDLSNAENYKLSVGDILFARTGASVGKSYIYKESDGLVYYAGFLIRARIKDEVNPEFVFQNTLTKDYEKYIAVTSQRSGQPGVNAQEYSEYKIMLPTRAEQDKISDYLRSLDHLITLHQRKRDELVKIKKYMLQNMFV